MTRTAAVRHVAVAAALGLAGVLALPGPGLAAPPAVVAESRTLRDVAYARLSPAHTLDLYLPVRSGPAVPVVVFVHGGAFSGGDKADVVEVPVLIARGFAVASVNYRLSGEAPFPAAVQDVKAAIRWLRAHAVEHGIDPSRVAIWGTSAGGYLAAMAGVSGGQYSALDDAALGSPGFSSQVQAVVSWYGPSDFAAMDGQAHEVRECAGRAQVHDDAGSPESVWLGAPVPSAPLVRASNPIAWLPSAPRGSLPPFLLGHGGADCLVPPGQSRILGGALADAGAAVTVDVVDGAGHADEQLRQHLLEPSLDFVAQALGHATAPSA